MMIYALSSNKFHRNFSTKREIDLFVSESLIDIVAQKILYVITINLLSHFAAVFDDTGIYFASYCFELTVSPIF